MCARHGRGWPVTPAQWKKLASDCAARSAVCGPVPGLVARNVLVAMLYRLAGGGAPRSQAELAAEMGLGERAMRSGIKELVSLGLVWLVRHEEDARVRLPLVNEAQVKAWARGDYVPEEVEIGDEITGIFAGDFKAETLRNAGHPRARGNSSSSSYATTPTAPADSRESFELYQAMLSAARKALPMLSPGAREAIWDWVGVYPVQLVQDACRVTARKGGRSLDYIEAVLSSMQAAALLPDDNGGDS